jgi:hypothetical protein
MNQELFGNILLVVGSFVTGITVVVSLMRWRDVQLSSRRKQELLERIADSGGIVDRIVSKRAMECSSCGGVLEWAPSTGRCFCFECGFGGKAFFCSTSKGKGVIISQTHNGTDKDRRRES